LSKSLAQTVPLLTLDRQAMQTGFYRRIDYATEGVV